MQKLFVAAILSALLGVPLAAAGNSHASGYPSSIAVLGTPTAAGWGAEAAHPFRDAPPDSRATGTNPTVKSVYSRILALNPAIKGHSVNTSAT
jgi:hypothetical protein